MDNYTITIPKKLIDDFINLYDDKYGGNESFFLNPLHEFLVSNIAPDKHSLKLICPSYGRVLNDRR